MELQSCSEDMSYAKSTYLKKLLSAAEISYIIPNKILSSGIAIFSATYPHGGDTINSKHFEYSVFYNSNTPIKLSLLW